MFAYCGNNPVNTIDPTGECWWIVAGAVGGKYVHLPGGYKVPTKYGGDIPMIDRNAVLVAMEKHQVRMNSAFNAIGNMLTITNIGFSLVGNGGYDVGNEYINGVKKRINIFNK